MRAGKNRAVSALSSRNAAMESASGARGRGNSLAGAKGSLHHSFDLHCL